MTNQANPQSMSLYNRLGRSEGIARLVDDIVDAHMKNPAIKARFLPYRSDPDRLHEVKRRLCEFLDAGTGGPGQYGGRSMEDAHRGMNIGEHEYMAALDDILAALRNNGVDEASQKDVLAIAYSLKSEILHC